MDKIIKKISDAKFREIVILGCELYNLNKIDDAHEKWEEIWKDGDIIQKKAIKGLIQISGALIQWERGKLDSVKYLLKLALKNIIGQKLLQSNFHLEPLIQSLKNSISKLENNNLNELEINIKF